MAKRMTRRQAIIWLHPMRECLRYILRTGQAYCIDGRPHWMQSVGGNWEWHRVDWAIDGFLGLIERLFPHIDTAALSELRDCIATDQQATAQEIEAALRVLNIVEDGLVRMTVADVQAARLTEEIQIELDAMREAA